MDDEAMKAMVDRIREEHWPDFDNGVRAAIIETRDRDAALVEGMIPMPGDPSQLHGTYAQGVFDAATAIRSGQHYGKDHPHE